MKINLKDVVVTCELDENNNCVSASLNLIDENRNHTSISPEALEDFKEILEKEKKWDELMLMSDEDYVPFYETMIPLWKQGNPPKSGRYLVTRRYVDITGKNVCTVDTASFTKDLYHLDEYDFYDKKGESGWYKYDSEYGYFEIKGVVAWQYFPEPFEG